MEESQQSYLIILSAWCTNSRHLQIKHLILWATYHRGISFKGPCYLSPLFLTLPVVRAQSAGVQMRAGVWQRKLGSVQTDWYRFAPPSRLIPNILICVEIKVCIQSWKTHKGCRNLNQEMPECRWGCWKAEWWSRVPVRYKLHGVCLHRFYFFRVNV